MFVAAVLIGKEGDSIGAVCLCRTVLVVTAQSRKKGIGKACGACLTVRENGSFSLIFDPTFRGKNITLGSAFERSESCSPSVQVRHWQTSLWAKRICAVCLWRTGGQGGTKFPLQATGSAWAELSAFGWQRTCLPYKRFLKSFWDLWRKKLGAKATFFLRNLSQLRSKIFCNFPDSTLVSDKGKFKPKSLKAGSAFNQSDKDWHY